MTILIIVIIISSLYLYFKREVWMQSVTVLSVIIKDEPPGIAKSTIQNPAALI